MKRYRSTYIFIILGLVLWQVSAYMIHNTFILPTPILVIRKMFIQLQSDNFLETIGLTVYRTLFSVFVSFVSGVLVSFLVLKVNKIEKFIKQIILFIQSVPNVTFIILFMFWFSKESIVFMVSFLLLFPVVYQNTIHTLKQIQLEWYDVLKIYPQEKSIILRKIFIPILKPIFVGTLSSTVSMGFKVGVMAEILSQVHNGIGRRMQLARLDVDLGSVIAWTIWLFICVYVCEKIIQKLILYICK